MAEGSLISKIANPNSLTGRFIKFAAFHAVAVGAMAYFLPVPFNIAHEWVVAKAAAMKSSLAAYAAATPAVPVGGFEAFTKSVAGIFGNIGVGGHTVDATVPTPMPL